MRQNLLYTFIVMRRIWYLRMILWDRLISVQEERFWWWNILGILSIRISRLPIKVFVLLFLDFYDKIGVQIKKETTAQDIEHDAVKILEYMKENVGFSLKDITILGRSIGSGPAVYVASIYCVGSLILLSPFLSLCCAVRDLYG